MQIARMKTLLLAGVSSIAITAGAFTGDARAQAPAINWTGFYVGGTIGGAWLDNKQTYASEIGICGDTAGASCSVSANGWVVGAHAGYLWQSGMIAYGVEGDFSAAMLNNTIPDPGGYSGGSLTAGIDAVVSLRGRIGVVHNAIYVYVTGGIAAGHLKSGWIAAYGGNLNHWKSGSVIGGGIEYAMNPRTTLRAEILHYDFGTLTANIPGTGTTYSTQFEHKMTTARIGLSLKW